MLQVSESGNRKQDFLNAECRVQNAELRVCDANIIEN